MEALRWIAHGPRQRVLKCHGYVIKGRHCHIKEQDHLTITQNSGVSVTVTTMQISSAKDEDLIFRELCLCGVITEIWDFYFLFLDQKRRKMN